MLLHTSNLEEHSTHINITYPLVTVAIQKHGRF